MSEKPFFEVFFEPERYELGAGPAYHFELSRRDFFKVSGGGIVVISMLKDGLADRKSVV